MASITATLITSWTGKPATTTSTRLLKLKQYNFNKSKGTTPVFNTTDYNYWACFSPFLLWLPFIHTNNSDNSAELLWW